MASIALPPQSEAKFWKWFWSEARRTRHKCPPYCHHCPIAGGLMPACMGGAVSGIDQCHCTARELPWPLSLQLILDFNPPAHGDNVIVIRRRAREAAR